MKILALSVLRRATSEQQCPEPIICSMATNLSSFGYFQRKTAKEMITFLSKTFIHETGLGRRQSVTHEGYVVYCWVQSDGLAGTVTTDIEYPHRVAFDLLGRLLQDFTSEFGDSWKTCVTPESLKFPTINTYLQQYQNPAQVDKVTNIQQELDETTEILHNNMILLLKRGAKLDELVDQSNDLSVQAKVFYRAAKKTNSGCCVIS